MNHLCYDIVVDFPNSEIDNRLRSDGGQSKHEKDYEQALLTFREDKIHSMDGNVFTGMIDAVTGDYVEGKLIYKATHDVYEGPFAFGGKRHGDGATFLKAVGKEKFIGSFRNDHYYEGTLLTSHGTYRGRFRDDVYHGQGSLLTSDGATFDGDFRNGTFLQGKLVEVDKSVYIGSFDSEGNKNGNGILTKPSGDCYSGEWESGLRSGVGTEFCASNGSTFIGNFIRDRKHGFGMLRLSSVVVAGCWEKGNPSDNRGWVILYPSRKGTYIGEAKHFRPHGIGTLTIKANEDELFVQSGRFCNSMFLSGEEYLYPLDPVSQMCDEETPTPIHIDFDSDLHSLYECLKKTWTKQQLTPSSQRSSDAAPLSFAESVSFLHVASSSVMNQSYRSFSCEPVAFKAMTTPLRTDGSLGTVYEGDMNGGDRHGQGTLSCKYTGFSYTGDFRNNMFSCYGHLVLIDGSTFQGDFVDGAMNGIGTFHDVIHGYEYNGDFKHGLKHGFGQETFEDGRMYCGEYRDSQRCGFGKLFQSEEGGDPVLIYKGDWIDGRMSGEGVRYDLTTPVKGTFTGTFKDGKREGHGTFVCENGDVFEGKWREDRMADGEWTIVRAEGDSCYTGDAKVCAETGLPIEDGHGSQKKPSTNEYYVGSFQDGTRHGSGICVYSSGDKWDGRWERGIFVKFGRTAPSNFQKKHRSSRNARRRSSKKTNPNCLAEDKSRISASNLAISRELRFE
eukprot:CAMPEP_0194067692 /NCGR_PEP_ID=MMETSP0009_2-20130614/86689_1 /TAXON_ID=210454 /ORGANISM="Grammatophora oceanica, Strain CCMP 410" /LENGTH=726 /DNA_ID=CAMNT_0038720725 /DNA_START=60 /DNA_END=2240 /DNA_ORIENTATION=+